MMYLQVLQQSKHYSTNKKMFSFTFQQFQILALFLFCSIILALVHCLSHCKLLPGMCFWKKCLHISTNMIDMHASQIQHEEYIPKYLSTSIFLQINKYSNNICNGCKLNLNYFQITSFCTQSCFVSFKFKKIGNVWNMISSTIMIGDARASRKSNFR